MFVQRSHDTFNPQENRIFASYSTAFRISGKRLISAAIGDSNLHEGEKRGRMNW